MSKNESTFSESGANLKPVSWEQGGTFGYTETFKLLTYRLYCNISPKRTRKSLLTKLDCERVMGFESKYERQIMKETGWKGKINWSLCEDL